MDKMKFNETEIPGVFLIENLAFTDNRGEFVKIYQESIFKRNGLHFNLSEHFFSISAKGVIRGLHFQSPPFTQEKLIYVPKGKIFDVIVDLRLNSSTYGKYVTVTLSSENHHSVFIPCGCAHGFQSLQDDTITVYSQRSEFSPSSDGGINPLSMEIEWPLSDYIISDKDKNLPTYHLFQSPFNSL